MTEEKNTTQESSPAATIRLKGVEKAAILFLCLREERGAQLMQELEENDIQLITKAMATLGTIPAKAVEDVIRDFAGHMNGRNGVIGSLDAAKRLLSGFLPDSKVREILSEIRHPDSGRSIWENFSAVNEHLISGYLQGEHDQTIAAILSRVKPDVAARVLPLFGEERMTEIATRMIGLDSLPQIVLEAIETSIQEDLLTAATKKTGPDPHQRMAEMFNRMDGDMFERLSEELARRAPQELHSIKQKMFTFDDLVKLDAQTLQRLMRNCDNSILPMALRGAKKPVRDAFLAALTLRARENMEEEMKTMGSVRVRDVREAQASIIDIANELAQQNIIRIPRDGDEMI